MRILHIITNTELGGAQKVCIDLCNIAAKEGHDVAVTSMAGGYLWSQLLPQVKQYQLKHMVKPIKPLKDLKTLFELIKVKKDFKPDIIQLHSSKAGILGRIVGLGMSKRVVYTVHGFDSIRLKYRIFLPLEKIFQHFCGGIVGVSDYDNKNLHSENITRNVCTIYNGISEKAIVPETKFPFSTKGKKIILSIARIAYPKRFDLFLDVARKFENENYLFVWIGGSQDKSLEQIKSEHCIPENVVVMGDVPNASRFIKLCDVFVLFSNFEGLPITIMEAMSQNKAIIASDVGGIHELVDDSNGKLVHNDVNEIVESIKMISSDANLRKQMEKSSYDKFTKNFTLDIMWNKYKCLYEQLLKEK